MPRKVIRYACDFKCGKSAVCSEKAMVLHEGRCKLNPDRKTCATCKHEFKRDDDYGCCEPSFGCDLDLLPDGKYLKYDCFDWQSRDNNMMLVNDKKEAIKQTEDYLREEWLDS